ncbi:MAG: ankyrin repeat domain-containing protein [Armatimonas sp.]
MSALPLEERREAIRRFAWAKDHANVRSVLLPIDEELEQAVLRDDLKAVQAALAAGACADVADEEDFYRALFWAVNNDNPEIVKLLIENQAEVNAENQEGSTILSDAVSSDSGGNPKIVGMLLDAGANVGILDSSGLLPHCWAAMRDNVEVLEMLRAAGANLYWLDHEGRDALMHAAGQGAAKACAYLIQHGADLKRQDMEGWTASDWARAEENEELAQWLEQQVK